MSVIRFAVPFGILHDYPLANLPDTWSQWYVANFSDPTTTSDVVPNQGECIMMGSRKGEAAATLSLAAFGRRDVIENAAGVQENGLFWYRESGSAVGFAPDNMVDLRPADMADPSDTERLSWHLDLNLGGYRSGATLDLNNDDEWRKVVMYGPCVVCRGGFYLVSRDCLPRDNGYDSYPGATRSLMSHGEAIEAYLLAPHLAASLETGHGLAITAQAQAALPEVYGGISLYYAFDLSTSTTALSHDSDCSSLWVQETSTSFSLTVTLPDVGVCGFNMTIGNSSATLSAYVGMFIVSDSGWPSAPIITPLTVRIPVSFAASVGGDWGFEKKSIGGINIAVGAVPSLLTVYETRDFEDPVTLLSYTAGDPVFLEMVATGERASSFMEFVFLWLSASDDPEDEEAVRQNLTSKVLAQPTSTLERGYIRLNFKAEHCEAPCWLHCLVRLRGAGRLLSDAAALTDKDYAWQAQAIAISEAELADEEVEEEVALIIDPLIFVLVAIPISFAFWPLSCLFILCKPPKGDQAAKDAAQEGTATVIGRRSSPQGGIGGGFAGAPAPRSGGDVSMPRPQGGVGEEVTEATEQSIRKRYGAYFFFETLDMLSDVGTLYGSTLTGELDHSNDESGLLFLCLLGAILLGLALSIAEIAILWCYGADSSPTLCGRKIIDGLFFLHVYFEDNYQMVIYGGITVSALTSEGEYVVSVIAFLITLVCMLGKAYEWHKE